MNNVFSVYFYYKIGKTPSVYDVHESYFSRLTIEKTGIAISDLHFKDTVPFSSIKEISYGRIPWPWHLEKYYVSFKLSKTNPTQYLFILKEEQKLRILELLADRDVKEIDNPDYLTNRFSISKYFIIIIFIILIIMIIYSFIFGVPL